MNITSCIAILVCNGEADVSDSRHRGNHLGGRKKPVVSDILLCYPGWVGRSGKNEISKFKVSGLQKIIIICFLVGK